MISAADLRRAQESNQSARKEEATQKEKQLVERFRGACDKYVDVLLDEAKKALEYAQRTSKAYIILDHRDITKDIEGFSYTSLLYGFWSRQDKKFDTSIFEKNEIKRPFDRAVEQLDTFGYKLENVSDTARSHRLFLKLSW
jgi:hypothetical protein